jgi:hypothetical protein
LYGQGDEKSARRGGELFNKGAYTVIRDRHSKAMPTKQAKSLINDFAIAAFLVSLKNGIIREKE